MDTGAKKVTNYFAFSTTGISTLPVAVTLPIRPLPWLTTELSDAGGPARPHWQLTWPARVRSSNEPV
jgi:hypothetical protein